MSIDQPDIIDFIGLDKRSGGTILTISDHLEWDEQGEHLLKLQAKINRYLQFIESGEIDSAYPLGIGTTRRIEVALRHRPDRLAEEFFKRVSKICYEAGIEFHCGPLNEYLDKDS